MKWHTETPPFEKPILAKFTSNPRYYVVIPYAHDFVYMNQEDFIPFYLEEAGGERYYRWDDYEMLGWVSFEELDEDSGHLLQF